MNRSKWPEKNKGAFKCVLRNKDEEFLMERYGEDIFDCDLTCSPGVEAILLEGGSLTFSYIKTLQKVETEDGFI